MKLKSWVEVANDSDFSIYNIPFGIYSVRDGVPKPATRLGDTIIDLSVLADFGYFDSLDIDDLTVFYQPVLNDFIRLGKKKTSQVRLHLQQLFSENNPDLRDNQEAIQLAFVQEKDAIMHLPVFVGNYTDFYASEQHAYNVGVMFRDPKNALLPNWKHIPVGYHGRASSIVVSGTNVRRPNGQTKADDQESPVFGPSMQVDFELELGCVLGTDTTLGTSIKTGEADDYIFGFVLFNDLSARDIQKWEYVPLGPFLSKNFGSVISPWIITPEALEPFRIPGPVQSPEVLPYLKYTGNKHFDINLQVYLETNSKFQIPNPTIQTSEPQNLKTNFHNTQHLICQSNTKYLYWNFAQMIAHHTVNGCNVRAGDICASGTISGPDETSFGSMLELAWKGTRPIELPDGTSRKFIQDHDTIVMKGFAEKDGIRVGFGECSTTIRPAMEIGK